MAEQVRQPDTAEYQADIFGKEISVEYSSDTVAYALVAMRIVMGWIFLQGGIPKVLDPNWTAAGFLNNVPEGNPFPEFFASMAGNPTIDFLNQWGLTLVGIALILGILTRWSAFWGAVMMFFYWLASLEGGLTDFLPIEYGYVVDSHIVYIFLLFGLGAFGAGRVFGLDGWLEDTDFVQNNRWLNYFMG
jgi:thiosulfate dehydrogenase [quinone] large subunit